MKEVGSTRLRLRALTTALAVATASLLLIPSKAYSHGLEVTVQPRVWSRVFSNAGGWCFGATVLLPVPRGSTQDTEITYAVLGNPKTKVLRDIEQFQSLAALETRVRNFGFVGIFMPPEVPLFIDVTGIEFPIAAPVPDGVGFGQSTRCPSDINEARAAEAAARAFVLSEMLRIIGPAGYVFHILQVRTLTKVGGDSQEGSVGTQLPQPLIVKVVDGAGNPVPDVGISWTITGPTGASGHSVDASNSTTGVNGQAQAFVTLGTLPGQYQITADCRTCTTGSPAVFTADAKPIPPPTVKLILPPEAQMGRNYSLLATITNNASVPIKVQLVWKELYISAPRPHQPAKEGTEEITLLPTKGTTVDLGHFIHTWDWIPQENPTKKTILTLRSLVEALIGLLREGIIDAILRGAAGLTQTLVELVELLAEAGVSSVSTININYTVSVVYDRDNAPGFSLKGPTLTEIINLNVPIEKQAWLMNWKTFNTLAAITTGAGNASLFVNPALSAAPFASQFLSLEIANLSYSSALDPPDSNFTEIAVPMLLRIAELDKVAEGPWKELAKTLISIHALKTAEAISINRSQGAAEAGNAFWQSAQLLAGGNYAIQATAQQARLVGILSLLKPSIIEMLTPHAGDADVLLQTQGLPELEIIYLTQFGWTLEELNVLRDALINAGTRPLDNPDVAVAATKIAGLASTNIAQENLARAIDIRVNQLGQIVRALTVVERQALDYMTEIIEAGLGKKIPSASLLRTVQTFIADVRWLVEETNNSVLLQDLEFGLSVLLAFQQFEVSIAGVHAFVNELELTGAITHHGIANSLRDKLADAQQELTEGDFEDVRGILGAFINEVQAQRGKKITMESADDLIGYVLYLLDFFPSG